MTALNIAAAPQLQVVPKTLRAVPSCPINPPEGRTEHVDDFWEIWIQHREYLHRFCLKWTGQNQTEANELLSLAREKAQSKWPQHAHKVTNPKSWLSSLTKHLYIDLYRARERQNKVHAGLQKEAMGAIANQPSPESNLLGNELRAYIYQLIVALPSRLRTPVILRFHQEKSYKEIAFQLSLSEATVRKRIQQARQQLRKPLRQYLTGLSQATITTNPHALNDLAALITPRTPIHNAPPVDHLGANVGRLLPQTQSSSLSYGITATRL